MIRIDKYLKLSMLVKRRTVAQEMVEVGAVRVNGKIVKPSFDVKTGDKIDVAFPRRVISVQVQIDDEALLKRRGAEPWIQLNERRIEPDQNPFE